MSEENNHYFCSHQSTYSKEEEDERAAARDIAEFERNKHLSKPCNTLDGFNERDGGCGFLRDDQLGLARRPRGSPPGRVSSLQVVGLNCMKPPETGGDEAPSRPLSRASRAESMGSLADFSCGFNQPSPADYEYSHRNRQAPDNYLRGSGRPGRRSVGGGGTLLQGRSPLSSCPPLLSASPYSHNYPNSRQKVRPSIKLMRNHYFLFLDGCRCRSSAEV